MTLDPTANFCFSTVDGGYDSSATAIDIVTGDINLANWPDPAADGAYNATWWNYTSYPNSALDPNKEIVRVTAINSRRFTITRAQESTTATDKNSSGASYRLALTPTAKVISDINSSTVDVGSAYGWVTEYTVTGDGVADDKAGFDEAAAALTHIVVPSGTWRFASSVTYGTGITWELKQGATIAPDTGITVTFNGPVIAGNYTIEGGDGTVAYGNRTALRWARWDGTTTDEPLIYKDGVLQKDVVVESSAIDVSTTGDKGLTIAHGLSYTPAATQITLTAYRSSGTGDPVIRPMFIEDIDGTNITIFFFVFTAAAATELKVVARIHPA